MSLEPSDVQLSSQVSSSPLMTFLSLIVLPPSVWRRSSAVFLPFLAEVEMFEPHIATQHKDR